ncbi:MAG: ribonuclease H-like domain-containing protein [Lachnospiraceae bacterium]|nr:ribonuclease H-like domain-containing protein [Lachnospiraceae bacterium]
MKTLTKKLTSFQISYPLDNIVPLSKALFLDIETTGFTARSSSLYLIGCAYYRDNNWYITQWFAENSNEEPLVLTAFFEFANSFTHLLHFNGNNFDLPYIQQKCDFHGLFYNFNSFQGIDLYKRIAPYKAFLRLENCKQKTIEQFLGLQREDRFNGGELISIYHDYVKAPDENTLNFLLLHNFEDMAGMLNILPILAFYDLFNNPVTVRKVQANYYTGTEGASAIPHQEILMKLSLVSPLPKPVSYMHKNCYFSGQNTVGNLRVPMYDAELKYFYSNYKDYYYLPDEDVALHKSVAGFVDRSHRIQATAANCYTRKRSNYLPQWDAIVEPFFREDYKNPNLYFEVTEELKTDRALFARYAEHILQMMVSGK